VVVDWFSHDTDKTANVHHRNINNNKTANKRQKLKKFTTTCKVDYTYITQLKLQKKNKKEGDVILHYIDIMAMCCRVISPFIFTVLVV